jgi:hypothetical protein
MGNTGSEMKRATLEILNYFWGGYRESDDVLYVEWNKNLWTNPTPTAPSYKEIEIREIR